MKRVAIGGPLDGQIVDDVGYAMQAADTSRHNVSWVDPRDAPDALAMADLEIVTYTAGQYVLPVGRLTGVVFPTYSVGRADDEPLSAQAQRAALKMVSADMVTHGMSLR